MVAIHLEPDAASPVRENCCFCRQLTRYWADIVNVACCPRCASEANNSDLPSKKEWFRKEEIIDKGRRNG